MAYLDLEFHQSGGGVAAVVKTEPSFTALEDRIIGLAHHDPVSSLRAPGKLRRAVYAVFGVRQHNHLADPRLEALRRYVVLLRLRSDIAEQDRDNFLIGGYSRNQRDELDRRLGIKISATDKHFTITLAIDWLGDRAMEIWLRSQVSNSFVAAMVIAYFGLPLAVSPKPWR